MTTLTILKFLFNLSLVLLGAYAIYREKDLIRFERKVWKYTKAFFKALYYTVSKKQIEDNESVESLYNDNITDDYEEILSGLNKVTETEDVLVA